MSKPIDLDALRCAAADGEREIMVTRRLLKQIVAEIDAGRVAQAQLAQAGFTFGLGQGVTL